MRESDIDAAEMHSGKKPTPTHYYLIHKITNQCHSLAERKGFGEQIRQVSRCVLLREAAHTSSYFISAIVIGNTVMFLSKCRLWG